MHKSAVFPEAPVVSSEEVDNVKILVKGPGRGSGGGRGGVWGRREGDGVRGRGREGEGKEGRGGREREGEGGRGKRREGEGKGGRVRGKRRKRRWSDTYISLFLTSSLIL